MIFYLRMTFNQRVAGSNPAALTIASAAPARAALLRPAELQQFARRDRQSPPTVSGVIASVSRVIASRAVCDELAYTVRE